MSIDLAPASTMQPGCRSEANILLCGCTPAGCASDVGGTVVRAKSPSIIVESTGGPMRVQIMMSIVVYQLSQLSKEQYQVSTNNNNRNANNAVAKSEVASQ